MLVHMTWALIICAVLAVAAFCLFIIAYMGIVLAERFTDFLDRRGGRGVMHEYGGDCVRRSGI